MPKVVRSLLAAVVVTAVVVGVGLLVLGQGDDGGSSDTSGGAAASAEPVAPSDIALGDFDTSDVALLRGSFCDRVPDESITAALGTDTTDGVDATTWGNGDDVELSDGTSDVSHEFGCRWQLTTRGSESVASGWVYAPPVTRSEGEDYVASASRASGCDVPKDAPEFGRPSLALVCPGDDGSTTVSFRGLFGDAWLVCQVTRPELRGDTPQPDVVDVAGRWCVTLARAASE